MRISKKVTACLALAALLIPAAVLAADGMGKDHPLLSRMPGYRIFEYEQGFGSMYVSMPTGEEDVYEDQRVEGDRTYIAYEAEDGENHASELAVVRNYTNALERLGAKILFGDNTLAFLRLEKDGRLVWCRVQSVEEGRVYYLEIVEEGEVEQVVTAGELMAKLEKDGHVAVYILFDTGKAWVKPESRPVVEQVAALLRENPALRLRVEGHTDNVGGAGANRQLSADRALAVVHVLAFLGADPSRLTPVGMGEDNPVADNGTEEGRAKNRRVELVKMQ